MIRKIVFLTSLFLGTCPLCFATPGLELHQVLEVPENELNPSVEFHEFLAIAFLDQGKVVVAAGTDQWLYVWKQRGKGPNHSGHKYIFEKSIKGHDSTILSLARTGKGSRLVASSANGKIISWDILAEEKIDQFAILGKIDHLSGNQNGHWAGIGNDHKIYFFDGQQLHTSDLDEQDHIYHATLSKDSKYIYTGIEGGVVVFRTSNFSIFNSFSVNGLSTFFKTSLSPSNKNLAINPNRSLLYWRAGEKRSETVHLPFSAASFEFLRENLIIAGCTDGYLRGIDTKSAKVTFQTYGHVGSVEKVAVHGQKIISAGFSRSLKVWRLDEDHHGDNHSQ